MSVGVCLCVCEREKWVSMEKPKVIYQFTNRQINRERLSSFRELKSHFYSPEYAHRISKTNSETGDN